MQAHATTAADVDTILRSKKLSFKNIQENLISSLLNRRYLQIGKGIGIGIESKCYHVTIEHNRRQDLEHQLKCFLLENRILN